MGEQTNIQEGQKPLSLIGCALLCIQTKNTDGLTAQLVKLNQRLTDGGKNAHFQSEDILRDEITLLFSNIEKDMDGCGDAVIYLGDGGFSRLCIGIDFDKKPYISLTYNSLQEVKDRWKILEEEYKNEQKNQ